MRLTLDRDRFASVVGYGAASLASNPAVPIYRGLLLRSHEGTLTVSGMDPGNATSAVGVVETRVGQDGAVLLPGRMLADISKVLPDGDVTLETDDNRVLLTAGRAKFTLPTMAVADYPNLPAPPATVGTISTDVLQDAVKKVAGSAGRDATTPVLTGIKLSVSRDRITAIATDRYRLAVRTFGWRPNAGVEDFDVLVPAKVFADLVRDVDGAEVALGYDPGRGALGLAGASRTATVQLLDGVYPRWQALMPDHTDAQAKLPRAEFEAAVKRVALASIRGVLRLSFAEGEVLLESGTDDEASASEILAVDYAGTPMTIAFNPAYLATGLAAIGSDEVLLSMTTPAKPVVLSAKDDDADMRYLLMPVRLT